jgi:Fe-S-cluster containining protein
MTTSIPEPVLVPGRSCAGCTLCCKIMTVEEIAKPRNKWCQHCDIGKGCKIYDARPEACRLFYCHYLKEGGIAEHWKPSQSRMMMTYNNEAQRLCVYVDPARPDAWRKDPYYADLKTWAKNAVASKSQVVVFVGDDVTVILPDRDKPIGRVRPDQHLRVTMKNGPRGPEYDVELLDADDPLLHVPQVR